MNYLKLLTKSKRAVTERLLEMRELAGADPLKHARYHKAVNRYQKLILRAHYSKNRFLSFPWFN